MHNEVIFGRENSFPHKKSHSAQMRGKGGKKAIFDQKILCVALAAENRWRDGDRLHSGYQYARTA